MSKKKNKIKLPFSIVYDAPVTLSFVIFSLLLFVLDSFILKQKLTGLFLMSPTSAKGNLPFELKNGLSYIRFVFYAFGGSNPLIYLSNMVFILLLGPSIEEKYGSIVVGIMMAVSSLFAGVLNACFRPVSLQGATAIVFMLIFLNSFMSFNKKKVPLSFVVVFVLYIVLQIIEDKVNGVLGLFINLAGGLCGSLFAFLASPKARTVRKASGLKEKAEALAEFDDSNSPRFKNKKKETSDDSDSEETVIGTLKF